MSDLNRSCKACGSGFQKRHRDSMTQWAGRMYCSKSCANRDHERQPVHVRFWNFVSKSQDGCWLWNGTKDGGGYGQISTFRGEAPAKAHRVSWEMRNGEIPAGMSICHKCDTPSCVNPDHLFIGTQADNARDMVSKGRWNKKSALNLIPGQMGKLGWRKRNG